MKEANRHLGIEDEVYGHLGKVAIGMPGLRVLRLIDRVDFVSVKETKKGLEVYGIEPETNQSLILELDRDTLLPLRYSWNRASGSVFEILEVIKKGEDVRFPAIVRHRLLHGNGNPIWTETISLAAVKEIPRLPIIEWLRVSDRRKKE